MIALSCLPYALLVASVLQPTVAPAYPLIAPGSMQINPDHPAGPPSTGDATTASNIPDNMLRVSIHIILRRRNLANARVTIAPSGDNGGGAQSFVTDRLGMVRVALPPGAYDIRITQGGTTSVSSQVIGPDNTNLTIDLTPS